VIRVSLPARVTSVVLVACLAAVALAGMTAEPPAAAGPTTPAIQESRILANKAEGLSLSEDRELLVKSVLNVSQPMRFGQFIWNDQEIPAGSVVVRVDLEGQTISVFRGGHEIGTAVILYGASDKPTPHGRFPVLEKREKHRSNLYDAEMPYMLRLTNDGIAIHASEVRQGAATHGCIGIPVEFARALFREVRRGDEVFITS
jgi:lipoprotein-anchoring transpeptidase ErfK/SrfK